MVLIFRLFTMLGMASAGGLAVAAEGAAWCALYDGGFGEAPVTAWTSPSTRSEKTSEGLRIVAPPTAKPSGRFYMADWHVDPRVGATVEARLKLMAASGPWGVVLSASDGVHEEGVSFLPRQVLLTEANLSRPFDTGGFHTYRIRIQGTNIQLWADGKLLLDGQGKFTAAAHAGRNQVGFGCGSSTATGESVWQYVRFQGGKFELPKIVPPKPAGLDVRLGASQIILPGAEYVSMFKFADGSIVVGDRRSADGGKTWRPALSFHAGAYQFPDGEILELGFHSKKTGRDGYFALPLVRSTDNGRTAKEQTAIVHIPEGTGGTDDDGKASEGPVADHAIVRLRDGSLLAAMYGCFKGDRVLIPTMPAAWRCYKYRSFVVRSTDRGKTWEYLATVAYDPRVGLESFCEPDLLTLPGGDILCFMRTGGSGGRYTPLCLSRSTDDGRTWSVPVPIADRGVWPNACRMQNGVIACTYGRPDNWLTFSLDGGRTWTGHFRFHLGASCSYNSVEEVAPDVLLVVYDRWRYDDGGNAQWETVGTTVTVKRR